MHPIRHTLAALTTVAAALTPLAHSQAAVIYTPLATPLTTAPNPGGGDFDGTGVWFNPLTAYAESRGFFFPANLFADGQFFLFLDASSATPQARIYTQGFFSRGNGVVYASSTNLNPANFGLGASIGPNVGYQNPGAGFPDLGPAFGNFTQGRSFIGLTLRDPTGASSSDVFYGFADITVASNYAITLNAFAFEDVRGAPITTFIGAPIPEPATALTLGLGVAGVLLASRRRRTA